MTKVNPVAKEFRGYAGAVFHGVQPSDIQIEETRKAFYAGYWSCIVALNAIGEPEVSEKTACEFMDARETECREFMTDVAQSESLQSPPEPVLLKYMTEPELSKHLARQIEYLKLNETPDTIGTMLIVFQDDNITQYAATIDPSTSPAALRELADRLERREGVSR